MSVDSSHVPTEVDYSTKFDGNQNINNKRTWLLKKKDISGTIEKNY